jgi:hypothetical protein
MRYVFQTYGVFDLSSILSMQHVFLATSQKQIICKHSRIRSPWQKTHILKLGLLKHNLIRVRNESLHMLVFLNVKLRQLQNAEFLDWDDRQWCMSHLSQWGSYARPFIIFCCADLSWSEIQQACRSLAYSIYVQRQAWSWWYVQVQQQGSGNRATYHLLSLHLRDHMVDCVHG